MPERTVSERSTSIRIENEPPLENEGLNGPPPSRARFLKAIEQNWGCRPEDCIPPDMIPRVRVGKGVYASITHPDKKKLSVEQWSSKLVKTLARLSSVTVHDIKFAHGLLVERVSYRHKRTEVRDYWAREVLSSDVEAVNTEASKLGRGLPSGSQRCDKAWSLLGIPASTLEAAAPGILRTHAFSSVSTCEAVRSNLRQVARLRSLGRYGGKPVMSVREAEMNGEWAEAPGHGPEGGDSGNDDEEGLSIDSPPGKDAPWPELEDLVAAEEARMLQEAKESWGYKEDSASP